ncbi:unnamed protein product [Parnassius apollo]|uniref:(apollo) hypothetical protein n=1 Tax=Parnassius apollo TaxID=110799 RepID=A0A8S3WP41_PARAO|nr:unnamed protein product [Parnassius apollo]
MRKEDLEAIRQDISSMLRRYSVPKLNLPKEEFIALKNLRNKPELTIIRADKGKATLVMDTSDYNSKIQKFLSDVSTYKKVKNDPTSSTLKTTCDLIKKHSEKLNLDVKWIIPTCAKSPKLYGLPKIHKPNAPLRPIVSQIDSPTYRLAQHLAKILSPLRGHTRAHIKDSYHFVSEIKDRHLSDNETMVSFDVQSLFTCLPVEDCISIVTRKLEENNMPVEYAVFLRHCLTSGYLLWKEEFYKQLDGVAMGSPVSPIVADIFMEDFEEKALLTSPINPRFYKQYVDDTFTILPLDKVTAFLDYLNSINSKIQFTMQLEANNSLAFIDVEHEGSVIVNTWLPSHHHVKQVLHDNKLRVPRLRHSERVEPATVARVPAVLPYIRGVTDKIGYILNRASIKTYFKPLKKFGQFLPSVKCNVPLQDAGVYKLDCEFGLSYIGQTKRSIKTRVKEHIADVKNHAPGSLQSVNTYRIAPVTTSDLIYHKSSLKNIDSFQG